MWNNIPEWSTIRANLPEREPAGPGRTAYEQAKQRLHAANQRNTTTVAADSEPSLLKPEKNRTLGAHRAHT